MSAKSSHFNSFGQILWNRWDLTRELRRVATYNIYYGTYVTSPATIRLDRDALTFARQHNIEIQPWGKSDLALHDPESLMEYHNARMFELSRADIFKLNDFQSVNQLETNQTSLSSEALRQQTIEQPFDPRHHAKITIEYGQISPTAR